MNIYIAGINGFIGSNLSKFLIKKKIKYNELKLKEKNVSLDIKKESLLVHCAQKNYDVGTEENFKSEIENIDYINSLKFEKVIFISTINVYENILSSTPEISKVSNNNLYCKIKLESEKLLSSYNDTMILRVGNCYGKDMSKKKLLSKIISSMIDNKKIKLDNINHLSDYIHISDVCYGIFLSIINFNTQIFNISSGNLVKLGDIVYLINNIIKKNDPDSFIPTSYGSIDISKSIRLLNWKPKKDINYGMMETINELNY